MKFNHVLNNFTAGQWSDKMQANTELEQYKKSCKLLQNMITFKQGGAYKRAGLKYIDVGTTLQGILNSAAGNINVFPITGLVSLSRTPYLLITVNNSAPNTNWYIYNISSELAYAVTGATATANKAYNLDNASYVQVGNELYIASAYGSMPMIVSINENYCYIRGLLEVDPTAAYKNVPYLEPNALGIGDPQTITASVLS